MNVSSIILWINCKQLSSIIVEDEINKLFTIQVLKCSQSGLNMNKILRLFRNFMNIKNIGTEYE